MSFINVSASKLAKVLFDVHNPTTEADRRNGICGKRRIKRNRIARKSRKINRGVR